MAAEYLAEHLAKCADEHGEYHFTPSRDGKVWCTVCGGTFESLPMTPFNERSIAPLALQRKDAAAALGISVDTFDRHVRPQLRCVYIGDTRLWPVTELDGSYVSVPSSRAPLNFRSMILIVVGLLVPHVAVLFTIGIVILVIGLILLLLGDKPSRRRTTPLVLTCRDGHAGCYDSPPADQATYPPPGPNDQSRPHARTAGRRAQPAPGNPNATSRAPAPGPPTPPTVRCLPRRNQIRRGSDDRVRLGRIKRLPADHERRPGRIRA